MTRLLPTALLLACSFAVQAADDSTRLLRFPDLHGDRVVFTYGGDLWTVSSAGGTATRLTSHPGLELFARFSPDGQWIAFTGQYDGDEQVYVMPAGGGVPRQLTFFPATGPLADRWGYDNLVYGWTPDGKSVLFRSKRDAFEQSDAHLYTVPVAGGLPVALPVPKGGGADFSPDGRQLAYSPLWRDFRTWKRYQGGWASDLYIVDLGTQALTRITDNPRTDRDPMWIGNAVWFASDRSGTLNLYRYDTASRATTQVTQSTTFDVRWPSADRDGHIVYELGGELHVYDTQAGSDRGLRVHVPTDGVATRPERLAVKDHLEQALPSPGLERVLAVAHGDVFTAPARDGVTRNLTKSSGAHDREAAWSPDGVSIAYVSDATGEEELYVRPADGSGAPRALTTGAKTRWYHPVWSPDSKRIALRDKNSRLIVVDVAGGKATPVADDPAEPPADYHFSPDSRYLAYTRTDDSQLLSVWVWSAADGQSRRVTPDYFQAFNPAWDPKGELLYFLSQREYQPQISNVEFEFAGNSNIGIFAVTLRRDVKSPYTARNDDEKAASTGQKGDKAARNGKEDKAGKDTEEPAPPKDLKIEFDGIVGRVVRVPVDGANYADLAVTGKHLLYRTTGPFYYGRDGVDKPQFVAYTIEDREAKVLGEGVEGFELSADGRKVLLLGEGGKLSIAEAGAEIKDAKPVSLDGLAVDRVPAEEFAQIFGEVWRRFRDHFYAANMHGYDWAALRDRYAPLVRHAAHRSDLNYIIGEMIAELSASHAYIQGGDFRLPRRLPVALPGARFELDAAAGRYRISKIFAGQNEEQRYRSPLTEVGVDVKVGDYVLAINGRELTAADNPWALLKAEKGKPVEWRVASRPDGKDARTITYEPIASEDSLLYLEWVRGNMERVTKASGGRLGYIHIPDMGDDGIREFIKWWLPQVRKEGLVVDVRGNGGGNVSQMLIERLSRKVTGLDYARNAEAIGTYPYAVQVGPMAALISETSASDGDIFPYMFREAGLGPLIGKRTWGGVVGITDRGPLLDGGLVFVPEFATASADGRYVIEGEGVSPDIVVENEPAAVMRGEDAQLDRAVAELLQKLPPTPRGLPPRPADPVKTR
jgi:tricorn protease